MATYTLFLYLFYKTEPFHFVLSICLSYTYDTTILGGYYMKKLNDKHINNQQLIDVRGQLDYQAGHSPKTLNLNPSNLKKYASSFISSDQAIIFIIDEESPNKIDELQSLSQELGFSHVQGYILANDMSVENKQQIKTINVQDFLEVEDDFILLDLRHPDEITRPAPKENLINIPLEDLASDYMKLDPSKTIFTLCGSGNRATAAASFLTDKGYQPVVIEGGMKAVQEVIR